MKKTLILVLIATLAAGFTLGCCGKMMERAMEEAIEAETGEDVDLDVSGGAKMPKDLPKALIYPGAKSKGSFSMSGAEGEGKMIALMTSASVSRVKRYYEGLDSKGWDVEAGFDMSTEEGEATMIGLTKGDFGAMVTIGEDENENKTAIVIIYGEDFNQ